MKEIKCPECGKVFTIDEAGYAQIADQVRNEEFNAELERRLHEFEKRQASDLKAAVSEKESEMTKGFADKENELREALSDMKKEKDDIISEKENRITELESKLENVETEKELAVQKAIAEKDKEIQEKAGEIIALNGKLDNKDNEREIAEKNLKESYELRMKGLTDEIDMLKDMKARLSTKMVGETLEQHCQIQFEQLRQTAFPNAYFEKDNEVKDGTKGDFIFRDIDGDVEYISIMFEMKNESDTTATKHKNEDFFKKLDDDRKKKNCEYAVLVSLLERENELYNTGIVDVSHRYEKMYVIRPQFFIPMLTLLTNAAKNTLSYQRELQTIRDQKVDFANFEQEMNKFKDGFSRNYDLASRQFNSAIDDINKSIKALEKTRDELTSSLNNLRLANEKAQDLSIKKLTKNAPSVREEFEKL